MKVSSTPLPRIYRPRRFVVWIAIAIAGSGPAANARPAGRSRELPSLAPAAAAVRHEDRVYGRTPQGELSLHFSLPADWKPTDRRPAIVFFFGGGWSQGSYTQFVPQADYFASRGMVAASADYRIASIHRTTPDKCVEDAKAAVRWLRQNAADWGIDPSRIVAAGGSAGGHLAACTALVPGFEPADDPVSSRPDALVLFNPALNIDELARNRQVPTSLGMEVIEAITPNRFVAAGAPPAIMFFGTDDPLVAGAERYLEKAGPLGVRAELWMAAGQRHAFFNRPPWIQVTARQADDFLRSLGYLEGEPTVALPPSSPALARRTAAGAKP
jgi:acetyl esterase